MIFVRRVRRLVVIDVRTGEEDQARNARLVEARNVRRLIRVGCDREVESGRDVRAFQQPAPDWTRSRSLHDQPVVLHAAHHVEVEVRGDLIDRHRRRRDEGIRSHETDLFRRPEPDQDVPPPRLWGPCDGFGDREHGGGARRIVVGAVMDSGHALPWTPANYPCPPRPR